MGGGGGKEILGRRPEVSQRSPVGRGLPQKVGAGLVQGMSQALEECEGPARMKEGRRDGVRFIAAGVAMQPRQEAGRGRTEAAAASQTQLGAAGSVTPLGGVGWRAPQAGRLGTGRPRCWQSGGGAARLRMGC